MAWALNQGGVRDGQFRFNQRVRQGWPGPDWVRDELVPAAVEAAQGAVFPERWPDAELLLAKSWWESVWNPDAVGRFVVRNGRVVRGTGGEVGVMQIKPAICRRYLGDGDRARLYPELAAIPAALENCAETKTNMKIAATILREHLATCDGRHRYALRFYATGRGCAAPRNAERVVTVWAQQLRETVPLVEELQ